MKSMDNRKGISPDDQNRQGSPSNLGNICGSSPSLELEAIAGPPTEVDAEIDLREVYFLIMHFLSAGPCTRTYGQIWNELLEHQLLPRRYHAWFSRKGLPSGDEDDDGLSLPLNYSKLVERYPHVGPDHLVKLLKQLLVGTPPPRSLVGGFSLSASDVPTLLGCGSISLLSSGGSAEEKPFTRLPSYLRWPHMQADQVHALSLREIGGGFTKHHRAPSIRAANYAIARPSTLLQKMEIIKKLRGHQNAVYCAIFDRTGRYVITGSDDRLVKIWSMETAFCLSSCRGHEGDITDLAVSSNNVLVASASNDFIIRVWRLPDGMPISVLRGHSGVVTAIAFSPRPSAAYQLLSSSDDGTCRIWDARASNVPPRVYIPKPPESMAGKSSDPIQTVNQRSNQILCCAFNANGTVFVTGSSDTYARVWNALKGNFEDPEQPNHELDVLSGHENDVNYVQFSGCAVASRNSTTDATKEDGFPKFKNSWFAHDNIVTCSRDGSAIIWTPRSRRSHGKVGKWTRAYHLKVPPPPMPPQPTRGGPRQRFLPTPRGVNMIVWSLDNRFVLAAIMDCRICVWNAADGSLVHSLTGHTQSTYVLDVHPFNPRIAMSTGYDGKTIVWDIWEGVPVRTYEIGRFKLVDGKFSPDGTSIVLSDEVGQIYILATGQGEAQKDAMFDQFFLGDYRPLIQDAQGNVLDQETQLPPFRRNMQDLLCDYSLIPYPDPYQSMYQQRRLGALGFEWRPPSVSLAVGPADLSVGGVTDYRIYFPQVHLDGDLDRLFDQPTDLGDFIDWEPEVEVQSDDADSEYNVTEESSEGEQGSLGASSSQDSMDDAEESDGEEMKNEHLRRSKRKKHKEVEIMTSFGRRVKRRNLDEHDVILPAHRKSKRRKNSHLPRKRGRSPKSSRPQRLAARNARNLFSRIGGTSSYGRDEEEEGREGEEEEEDDSPNDEALQHDTIVLDNEHKRRGVVVRPDEGTSVNAHHEKIDPEVKKTRRLVFKLPARDSKKVVPFENNTSTSDVVSGTKSPVKELPEGTLLAGRHLNNQKQILVGESSGGGNFDSEAVVNDMIDSGPLEQNNTGFENVEGHHSSSGNKGSEIKWGEVKMRTSKRLRLGDGSLMDPWPSSDSKFSSADEFAHGGSSNMSNPIQVDKIASEDSARFRISSPKSFDPVADCTSLKIQSGRADSPVLSNGVDGNSVLVHANDEENQLKCQSALANGNGNHQDTEYHVKVSKNKISIPFKLKIRSKTMVSDSNIASSAVLDTSEVPSRCQETYCPNQNLEVGPIAHNRNSGEWDTSDEYHIMSDRDAGTSDQYGSSWSNSDGSKKVYTSVYKRSKLSRYKAEVDLDHNTHIGDAHVDMDNSDHNYKQEVASTSETVHRTRSMGLRSTRFTGEDHKSSSFRCRESHRTVRDAESLEPHNQYLHEESRPISRANVGVRSTRGKRGNFYNSEQGSFGRSSLPVRKLSWLLLYENEGGYRYIPQMGDEVAYLRQGHKEFLEQSRLHQKPPYIIYKDIRAFEFCKINALDYSFLPSGDSCCKLTLEFVDPSSSVCGETFSLSLPELTDFPDFLVERTRFDASIARNWTHRDKCQVWWRSDGAEGGSWWEGRILSVKPKSIEYPDSPWERFVVQYKNESSEPHLHSPWELHEPGASSWEHPHIDPTSKTKLLSCFAKLERLSIEKQDQYGLLKLDQVSQKSDFFNRFPLPLSFDLIKRRLENGYYRSLEAVKHDFIVMLSNAKSYFAKSAEMSAKMRRLSDWISIIPL